MSSAITSESTEEKKKERERAPYQKPAIIYEGVITTRAGSPLGASEGASDAVDPADLFGG